MKTTLVEKAYFFARFIHAEQLDKNGIPYILHPVAVENALHAFPPHVRAAALLHDVVEDTDTTLSDLAKHFPVEVVQLVAVLTRRPVEPYFDYIRRVHAAGPEAIAIKVADICDNMRPERAAPDSASLTVRYEKALRILKGDIE